MQNLNDQVADEFPSEAPTSDVRDGSRTSQANRRNPGAKFAITYLWFTRVKLARKS